MSALPTRSRPRTRRSSADPATRPLLVGLGVGATLLAVLALVVAFRAPTAGVPGASSYELQLEVASLENLGTKGADVRIAGKRVGQTTDGRLIDGVPTITLRLEGDAGPLPSDTRARLRLRGLLGAQYVQLIPGRSSEVLGSGATIPRERSSAVVQLPDLLETFDARTRDRLGTAVRGLGGGLAGRGAGLGDALDAAPGTLEAFSAAVGPLLQRAGATTRFIAGAEAVAAAFEPVRADFAPALAAARRVTNALAQERAALARTIDVLPGVLGDLRPALDAATPALASATRFARATTAFTAEAPPALRATTRLLEDGRAPLRTARPLLADVRRTVPPLSSAARGALVVPGPLEANLDPGRSIVRELGSKDCRFEAFVRNWRRFLGNATKGSEGKLGPNTLVRLTVLPPVAALPGRQSTLGRLPTSDPTDHTCSGGTP